MEWILCPLLGYLMGAVPFGLVVARLVKGVDPRLEGSRNTGATNVARLCGAKWGVAVLLLDVAKGMVPVLLAARLSDNWLLLSLTAGAAVAGHVKSPFLEFKGGKAVATTIGVFLGLAPLTTLAGVALTAAVIALSGFVSLGSLTLALALPVLCLLTGQIGYLPLAAGLCLTLFWTHRENIRRLDEGRENPWRSGK